MNWRSAYPQHHNAALVAVRSNTCYRFRDSLTSRRGRGAVADVSEDFDHVGEFVGGSVVVGEFGEAVGTCPTLFGCRCCDLCTVWHCLVPVRGPRNLSGLVGVLTIVWFVCLVISMIVYSSSPSLTMSVPWSRLTITSCPSVFGSWTSEFRIQYWQLRFVSTRLTA